MTKYEAAVPRTCAARYAICAAESDAQRDVLSAEGRPVELERRSGPAPAGADGHQRRRRDYRRLI